MNPTSVLQQFFIVLNLATFQICSFFNLFCSFLQWTPPNVSVPLLNLVDKLFQLKKRGWLRLPIRCFRRTFFIAVIAINV